MVALFLDIKAVEGGARCSEKHPHSRRCRQLPTRGAEKPLFEERCHEVTERDKNQSPVKKSFGDLPVSFLNAL